MQAVLYHDFGGPLTVEQAPDPTPHDDGAVIQVAATGLCRSDWHGWRGHDTDIQQLPHVPGHELAGRVVEVGRRVSRDWIGRRVTLPFVCGCGVCVECERGNQHICDRQFQPGFTAWGSFAELVAVRYANENLTLLPDAIDDTAAASLGCRLATAYRAVAHQGRVQPGQWLSVHGCGGVGLSAVMVGVALGARVIAIDTRDQPLTLARSLGAEAVINATDAPDVADAVHQLTRRGADVSLDAIGSAAAMTNSILSLRKRGRHVQVGLLAGEHARPATPMERVIGWELELLGSHGLQAHAYRELFALMEQGKLQPERLVERTLSLGEAPAALAGMDAPVGCGVTVILPASGNR